MAIIALVSNIILSILSLAWGFAEAGMKPLSDFLIFFGIVWLYSLRRHWDWFSSLGLFVAIVIAAIGIWLEIPLSWMIAGVIFALFAWEMAEYRRQRRFMVIDDNLRGMERRHIARISLAVFAGLILISLDLLHRGQFTLEWGVMLAVVTSLGFAQVMVWLKQH